MTHLEWIELLSVLSGILAVWFNARQNILGWPVGLVSISLAAIVYWHSKLFGEFALQAFFAISSVYGWMNWAKMHQQTHASSPKPIVVASWGHLFVWVLAGLLGTIGCYYLLNQFTNGDLLWWDSLITAFSLVGQLMLARKVIQNWLIWIAVDVLAAGVYFYKELYFMSIEFLIFCGLAWWGYRQWKQKSI